MNLNQSTATNQLQDASAESFRFLDLPPEIRNITYSFVTAQVETDIVFPISKKLTGPRTTQSQGKACAYLPLLLTCKQIRTEAYHYIYGVAHGTFHWPNEIVKWSDRCKVCGNLHRSETLDQIARTLDSYGHLFQRIPHLDLFTGWYDAEKLISQTRVYRGENVGDNTPCAAKKNHERRLLERVMDSLQNVDTLTFHVDGGRYDWFQKHAETLQHHRVKLLVFPKLRRICVGLGAEVKIVAQRDPIQVKADWDNEVHEKIEKELLAAESDQSDRPLVDLAGADTVVVE